jgi:hypothetical protein
LAERVAQQHGAVGAGEALHAPALSPVACWSVERRDGKVFVREQQRQPTPALQDKISSEAPDQIVIIGGGAAGFAAAGSQRFKSSPRRQTPSLSREATRSPGERIGRPSFHVPTAVQKAFVPECPCLSKALPLNALPLQAARAHLENLTPLPTCRWHSQTESAKQPLNLKQEGPA